MSFAATHRDYIKRVLAKNSAGLAGSNFRLKTIAAIEPLLAFLYEDWWDVQLDGLKHLPKNGPVCLVANAGGVIPWSALMLAYHLMRTDSHARRLNIMADLDWIEDERIYGFLTEIGFVNWTADNTRSLLKAGETIIIFPEGTSGWKKPFGERYRLRPFDWTKIMPLVELKVPCIPMAVVGPEESFPISATINLNWLSKWLSLPAVPVTPLFPFLPFPINMFSWPAHWHIRLLKPVDLPPAESRQEIEAVAKSQALFLDGEVQAELNRLLRKRVKPLF